MEDVQLSDRELDNLEVELMVDIEDPNASKKKLVSSCKKSLQAVRYLRKELDFYTEEYYLPADAPEYFEHEDVIKRSCNTPKFDVVHHIVDGNLVTRNHYQYSSRLKAFCRYADLLGKAIDDYVELVRLDISKPITY